MFGLSPAALIQLALGLLKAFNWIAAKIDQYQWIKQGQTQELQRELDAANATMARVAAAKIAAGKATPDETDDSLGRDL